MGCFGSLFCIVAPSGAGKTTLVRSLVNKMSGIQVSVSTTTRPPRPGDKDGVDYFFLSRDQFDQKIAEGEFLEYAEVYGNWYGTSRTWVESHLAEGTDVILEIDWQGAEAIKALYPNCVSIYILPPSLGALHSRLVGRDQDSPDVLNQRFEQAVNDMMHHSSQDFIVINEFVESALTDLEHIVHASRLRTVAVQTRSKDLLAELIQNG